MIRVLLVGCLVAQLLLPNPADAFDGSRKGFFLSVGVGPGFFEMEQLAGWGLEGWVEKGSTASSVISFGAGSSDRFLVYFSTYADLALDSTWATLGSPFGITCSQRLRRSSYLARSDTSDSMPASILAVGVAANRMRSPKVVQGFPFRLGTSS